MLRSVDTRMTQCVWKGLWWLHNAVKAVQASIMMAAACAGVGCLLFLKGAVLQFYRKKHLLHLYPSWPNIHMILSNRLSKLLNLSGFCKGIHLYHAGVPYLSTVCHFCTSEDFKCLGMLFTIPCNGHLCGMNHDGKYKILDPLDQNKISL